MDQKKIKTLQIKLMNLSYADRCSNIYQWILTKHIRLAEFVTILDWCMDNPPPTKEIHENPDPDIGAKQEDPQAA